jgi:RND superfamily putative drug exporter
MLGRVARWCYTHRWRTLVIWIVALVAAGFLGSKLGGDYASDFSLPGAESQKAFDLLKDKFPQRSGDTSQVVFKADAGVASVKPRVDALFADIEKLRHVESILSPYSPQGARQVSPGGKIAFATIQFDVRANDVPKAVADRIIDLGKRADGNGLQVDFGGPVIENSEFQPPGQSTAAGLLAAMVILLIAFGSVLAMGLPIMTALFGIGIGSSLILLFANFIAVPDFTTEVAAMIGLGVGIDYSLFIVTRYRRGLREGLDPEAGVLRSMATAGRAVLFAGIVVVISLLGALLMGLAFLQGIAIGGAAVVFTMMLAALTLLPAVLGFVGRNIEKLHIPFLGKKDTTNAGFWFRWSRMVQRRPAITGLIGLVLVLALAAPLLSIRLGSADAGNEPTSLTTRRAYDLLSEGFGPGFNGPLLLAAEVRGQQDMSALQRLDQSISGMQGVAFVTPVVPNPQGDAAIITVYPTTSPQDVATSDLVHRLRSDVVPSATASTGTIVHVGGLTAIFTDFASTIGRRMPIMIAVVIALAFLLLMAVFRSVVVPLKAAVMNLLSIGASYGVIVAVFQWGWGRSLIGIDKTGPVESWIPMMMFVILFGLSMDYEIFLLSRIREEYLRTKDNATAVASGVATTGRLITAAALIMIAVFLSFVVGFDLRQIKEIGLGLAVAIFVDATLIRMVLVPSIMQLLGDVNWWLPAWLGRLLPKVRVETGDGQVGEPQPALVGVSGDGASTTDGVASSGDVEQTGKR